MNPVVILLRTYDKIRATAISAYDFFAVNRQYDRRSVSLQQAHFLLSNIFDEDVHCPVARQELKMSLKADTLIATVMHLYAAYAAFSEFAREHELKGFEIDANWLERLSSANRHLFENIISKMSSYEQSLLYHNFPRLYSAASKATYHFTEEGSVVVGDTTALDSFELKIE